MVNIRTEETREKIMERSQNSGTSPHFSRLLSDSQKKSLNKDGRLDEAR
jgi:hypothetical protein